MRPSSGRWDGEGLGMAGIRHDAAGDWALRERSAERLSWPLAALAIGGMSLVCWGCVAALALWTLG